MGLLEVLVQLSVFIAVLEATTGQVALPGCPDRCGNIIIPYPFGIGVGCYIHEAFSIECRQLVKPFMSGSNMPVTNISLEGYLRVPLPAAYTCYEKSEEIDVSDVSFSFSQFSISDPRNKLTAVSCSGCATLQEPNNIKKYTASCVPSCPLDAFVANGSCSSYGCSQFTVPKGMTSFHLSTTNLLFPSVTPALSKLYGPEDPRVTKYRCSYAFLVEEGAYNFVAADLLSLQKTRRYHVILEWWIGQVTCEKANQTSVSYACKSQNSICVESDNGPGYRCNCTDGYTGNPYLPNGCQDINECDDPNLNHCISPERCRNIKGNYTCLCPKGHHGDGRKNGVGCIAGEQTWTKILIGVIIGLLVLSLGISWLYWAWMRSKITKTSKNFFERNGGLLLQQQLLKRAREQTRIFSAEDLKKATDNYHESRIVGQGGQGTVYKGILPDDRTVAIKKAKIGDGSQVEEFINELVVLSQINHRNVVKLLGFCLETEVPLLVYEFATNGSLYDHMHDPAHLCFLTWKTRLNIAIETAGALSYLHSATSMPIIHRDIKSANILLDGNFAAKVSDFGTSRLIPLDQQQLTTLVRGTLGYLDPEYFHTSHLNEKSDVYSFGVVLMELLTGDKALVLNRAETERHLVTNFVSAMKENRVAEILDRRIQTAGNSDELRRVADLATRCVRLRGEERPTMKEVAIELEGLKGTKTQPWVESEVPYTHIGGTRCKEPVTL